MAHAHAMRQRAATGCFDTWERGVRVQREEAGLSLRTWRRARVERRRHQRPQAHAEARAHLAQRAAAAHHHAVVGLQAHTRTHACTRAGNAAVVAARSTRHQRAITPFSMSARFTLPPPLGTRVEDCLAAHARALTQRVPQWSHLQQGCQVGRRVAHVHATPRRPSAAPRRHERPKRGALVPRARHRLGDAPRGHRRRALVRLQPVAHHQAAAAAAVAPPSCRTALARPIAGWLLQWLHQQL